MVSVADAECFHHDIAGSPLAISEGLGHVSQAEDPSRTVAAVQQLLELGQ